MSSASPQFVNTTKKIWIDRGRYWEHTAPQGTEPWKEVRIGRNTTSTTGGLAGKSSFKTPEQTGKIIAGIEEETLEEKNIEYMNHGTVYEKIARKWVEDNLKCKILERGLCVLKNDTTLGASIDGEIVDSDTLIEIKCPQKMYNGIVKYTDAVSCNWKPPSNYCGHIFSTHLLQMLQACFILGKKYCIYVVYCVETQEVFTQKIAFDPILWEQHHEIIKKNYDLYVLPHIKDTKYPLLPF